MPNPIVWHIRRVSWSETFGVNIESVGAKRVGRPGFQRFQRVGQINGFGINYITFLIRLHYCRFIIILPGPDFDFGL